MAKKQIEHSEQTGVASQRPRRRGRIAAPPGSAEAPVMSPAVERGGSDNQPTDPRSVIEAKTEPMVPPVAASGDPGAETETARVSGPANGSGAIGNPTPRPNTKRAALLEGAEARSPGLPMHHSKKASILALLQRPQGAAISDLTAATGWQVHSVRAALTGLRKEGREVLRNRDQAGVTLYRIAEER